MRFIPGGTATNMQQVLRYCLFKNLAIEYLLYRRSSTACSFCKLCCAKPLHTYLKRPKKGTFMKQLKTSFIAVSLLCISLNTAFAGPYLYQNGQLLADYFNRCERWLFTKDGIILLALSNPTEARSLKAALL